MTNVKCRVKIMNVKIMELVSLQMKHSIVGMYQVLVTKQYVERKTGRPINLPIGLVYHPPPQSNFGPCAYLAEYFSLHDK